MSEKATAKPGRYNPDLTPWVLGMHEAIDDPAVYKVVAVKSAQVGWTDGVLLNYIGKKIDVDPSPMIVMFAKEKAASQFNQEKFVPMAEVTPRVAKRLRLRQSRDRDNKWDFKAFDGGFLKFVGSNSPSSVKSTSSPVVAVEEPDDCNDNVRDQGDTITALEERAKTYEDCKIIFGGTPTIKGISRIDNAYQGSDKRVYLVPCHECGEAHVLDWENVRFLEDESFNHEVFGHIRPETASYSCPHCGVLWTDLDKERNVKNAYWQATAPFYGVAGFYINELYSSFPGSTLQKLLEKYLVAQHLLAQGDDTKMRVFVNNSLGKAYEYVTDIPRADVLAERAEDYAERTVPWGGMVLTAGVDVQHDRVAVVIRAWGRGAESWLVYWGEIYGQTLIEHAGAWVELLELLTSEFTHVNGNKMTIRAVSIDSSDGTTMNAVYAFVRKHRALNFMAVKGASEQSQASREIFSRPSVSIDNKKGYKPHPTGVRPFIVGTQRAKDLMIDGRLKLTGNGPGRMHWYKTVRNDYWEQITSEIKAPHKSVKNRKVWQKRSGVRNEALDCEVYALHASMALRLHLFKPIHWDQIERQLRQREIFADSMPIDQDVQTSAQSDEDMPKPGTEQEAEPEAQTHEAPAPTPQPTSTRKQQRPRRGGGGYSASNW